MHLFKNDDHKTKHLKIFQYKLTTILCMLDDSMQGTLNIYIYYFFSDFLHNMEDLSIPYQALGKEETPP